jgi:hypothetical protein
MRRMKEEEESGVSQLTNLTSSRGVWKGGMLKE